MGHRLAGIVVALIIIVAAVGTLGYRKAYGTWWQTPQRIAYCERTYETGNGPAVSRADIEKRESKTALPGDAPYPVVTVGKVPPIVGQPLVAAVTPEAARHKFDPPVPCAMGVYLKTGADAYIHYGILGGP
ncbi:MAG: hypothetical protein ACYDDU_18135 [Dermatophilaceae bacterium]